MDWFLYDNGLRHERVKDHSFRTYTLYKTLMFLANYDNKFHVTRFGIICTILKNVGNTHEGVLLLVKLQAEACNFTKSNTPS